MFMFDRKGIIQIEGEGLDEDTVMEAALEAGAEDFEFDGDVFEIATAPNDLGTVRDALEEAGYSFLSAEVCYVPQTMSSIDDEEVSDKFKGDIILRDNYTNETKLVSFFNVPEVNVRLGDYDVSWGWNLLLPNEFFKINEKIEVLRKQNENKAYSQSKIAENEKEIIRLSEIKKKMIDGFYSFYLFNNDAKQRRIGNFIDESFVTERIEDVNDWDAAWGVAHEILMKILIENCGLNKTDEVGVRMGDDA
jgi:hypothetical protein